MKITALSILIRGLVLLICAATICAGYTMFKDAWVISGSSKELRELIIDWVKRNGRIPTTATNNWRLLPER